MDPYYLHVCLTCRCGVTWGPQAIMFINRDSSEWQAEPRPVSAAVWHLLWRLWPTTYLYCIWESKAVMILQPVHHIIKNVHLFLCQGLVCKRLVNQNHTRRHMLPHISYYYSNINVADLFILYMLLSIRDEQISRSIINFWRHFLSQLLIHLPTETLFNIERLYQNILILLHRFLKLFVISY